ncbi:MAG: hypothetical protein J6U86_04205 [Clostridia bacterium]|nr:hypothetical protein [Clostridia bacterium]
MNFSEAIKRALRRSKDYSDSTYASALREKKTGSVLLLDHVSPLQSKLFVKMQTAEHPEIVNITAHGRNLFDADKIYDLAVANNSSYSTYDRATQTFTTRFTGVGAHVNSPWWKNAQIFPKGTYTITIMADTKASMNLQFWGDTYGTSNPIKKPNSNTNLVVNLSNNTIVKETVYCDKDFRISIHGTSAATVEAPITYSYRIMVEEGEGFTGEFVTYQEPRIYNADTNGDVSITPYYPDTYIKTDSENTLLFCEYTKDLNGVIKDLTNAVVQLGNITL